MKLHWRDTYATMRRRMTEEQIDDMCALAGRLPHCEGDALLLMELWFSVPDRGEGD